MFECVLRIMTEVVKIVRSLQSLENENVHTHAHTHVHTRSSHAWNNVLMCPGSLSGWDEVIASVLLRGFGYISFMWAVPKESTPSTLLCPLSTAFLGLSLTS